MAESQSTTSSTASSVPESALVVPEIRALRELLAGELRDDEDVVSWDARRATALGENYGSCMLTLDVVVGRVGGGQDQRHVRAYCKMLPVDKELRVIFNVEVTFVKELEMYTLVVPALVQLQRDANVPDEDLATRLFPRCYGGRQSVDGDAVDDDAALVLEDLRERGFRTGDRRVGLDLHHAELVMRKLAVFHALPVALRIKRPEVYRASVQRACRDFRMNDVPDRGDMDEVFVRAIRANVTKALADEPDPEAAADMIDAVERACRQAAAETVPPVREPFASILHNDLWTNNMLFDGAVDAEGRPSPSQVVFIDFQMTRVNSPFKDVLFFLFTSVRTEVCERHLDQLIEAYHASFVRCLGQVGVDGDVYSLAAARAEIDALAGTELFHILSMLRFLLADPAMIRDNPDTFAMREDLGGEAYTRKAKRVVLQFAERGWLN